MKYNENKQTKINKNKRSILICGLRLYIHKVSFSLSFSSKNLETSAVTHNGVNHLFILKASYKSY